MTNLGALSIEAILRPADTQLEDRPRQYELRLLSRQRASQSSRVPPRAGDSEKRWEVVLQWMRELYRSLMKSQERERETH